MKKNFLVLWVMLLLATLPLLGQSARHNNTETDNNMENNKIKMTVGNRMFTVTLNGNSSCEALVKRLKQGNLHVHMDDYNDMEKVGPLGFSLPRNDRQNDTGPGDIILYQGNYLVIYYDNNSWNFTRLGKVDSVSSRNEMLELLGGKGEKSVILSL
jgi:hypothetical protein